LKSPAARFVAQVHSRRMERRKEVRVGLRVPLKLSGDARGKDFSLSSMAENVSKGGSFALARWF
jgi:hypothetical protein